MFRVLGMDEMFRRIWNVEYTAIWNQFFTRCYERCGLTPSSCMIISLSSSSWSWYFSFIFFNFPYKDDFHNMNSSVSAYHRDPSPILLLPCPRPSTIFYKPQHPELAKMKLKASLRSKAWSLLSTRKSSLARLASTIQTPSRQRHLLSYYRWKF